MARRDFLAGFKGLLMRDVGVPSADELLRDDITAEEVDAILQSFPPEAQAFLRAEMAKDAAALSSASPVTKSDLVDAVIATLVPFPPADFVLTTKELDNPLEHKHKMERRDTQLTIVNEWISKVGETVPNKYTGSEYYKVTAKLVATFFKDKKIPQSVDTFLRTATHSKDTFVALLRMAAMGGGAGAAELRPPSSFRF
jgi:hypothetical protein